MIVDVNSLTRIMKLLRIEASGFDLFENNFSISFLAKQRVTDDDTSLHHLFHKGDLNPINALIGVNASGKTSTLKLISLVIDLLNFTPLKYIKYQSLFCKGRDHRLCIYFYTEDGMIHKLDSRIHYSGESSAEGILYFSDEYLYSKKVTSVKTKAQVYEFDDSNLKIDRKNVALLLPDDISILLKLKKDLNNDLLNLTYTNSIDYTNINILNIKLPDSSGKGSKFFFPVNLIHFLDPSVESLELKRINNIETYFLKFNNGQEFAVNSPADLENYLSSGTIKGLYIYLSARQILKTGGILLIDEIENHFNQELVKTLLSLFERKRTNPHGALIVFTTHYSELLDLFDRNDCINLVRHNYQGNFGISIENLSDLLDRNDLKRSDVFKSDYIGGTSPSYSSYKLFEKELLDYINSDI